MCAVRFTFVIFFSSLIAGLCRSVCNIITEKANTNATSADGNTSARHLDQINQVLERVAAPDFDDLGTWLPEHETQKYDQLEAELTNCHGRGGMSSSHHLLPS